MTEADSSQYIATDAKACGSDFSNPVDDQNEIGVIYRRRKPENVDRGVQIGRPDGGNRLSLAPGKRISWNRSLSTRGRKSIIISVAADYRPQLKQREARKKPKQAFLNRKVVHQPQDFTKERAYFQEIDSFDLLEESPSPKHSGTWIMGAQNTHVIPDLSSILERWLISKKLTYSCGSFGSLSRILETPLEPIGAFCANISDPSNEQTPERSSTLKTTSRFHLDQNSICSISMENDLVDRDKHPQKSSILNDTREGIKVSAEGDTSAEDLGEAVKKLSLTSRSESLDGDHWDTFNKLLMICGQSVPSRLVEVFSHYCDPNSIVKIGEGTYGEAFKAGATVCKIVPIDGDLRVNGEIQKRSAEVLEEVLLCWALNSLRGQATHVDNQNTCTNFIETKDVRVCHGAYDASLIRAWEEWDVKNGSENDNPKEFQENQCYVVFVLADGGRDLESFVLMNFDEARSLLVQVTAALAVAEVACEFEHRDLHWGNILLTRNGAATMEFTLQGRRMLAKTFGLSISIIDFTLSRIKAVGEAILFLDLSTDPEIFEGPKGDKQSETYRKMKEVTDEFWEGSFPKTNVLWLQYLVDILLLKKTFQRTAKDERVLRSFRKCLNSYDSAKDALSDAFFNELWVDHAI
ncbi:protein kinase superfamily protein isoform X2 [Tasmannia lanceolata]|uniref:protein kinase superfamily protein isoform X2 n=1 Tax=Tasmannia lanceolata TaxID=3420 RepID=UPI0040648B4D